MKLDVRRFVAAFLLLLSLLMMVWSLWPASSQMRTLIFNPQDLQLNAASFGEKDPKTILETRKLILTWPESVRSGEVVQAEAAFLPIESGDANGLNSGASAMWADVFETYHVLVEGRLELPGLVFSPDGQISQALQANEPVKFIWNLRAEQATVYKGTLWVYLRFISKATGQELKQVLTAQLLDFKCVDFLGLDYLSTRLIGSLGLAIGLVLSFDRIFLRVWTNLFRNRHR